jgi:hypothetical protein
MAATPRSRSRSPGLLSPSSPYGGSAMSERSDCDLTERMRTLTDLRQLPTSASARAPGSLLTWMQVAFQY